MEYKTLERQKKSINKKLNHIIMLNETEFKCLKHNYIFKGKYRNVYRNIGCKYCSKESFTKNRTIKPKVFIKDFIKRHKNKYDYSLIKESDTLDDILEIICPSHGVFTQWGISHKNNIGCSKCGDERVSQSLKFTLKQFIDKSNKIHNDFYDYSLISEETFKLNDKVEIICPVHGKFSQIAAVHNSNHGCKKCATDLQKKRSMFTQKEIENKIKKRFEHITINEEYKGSHIEIEFKCKKHGIFKKKPYLLFQNVHGCPQCFYDNRISKGHNELFNYIKTIYSSEIKLNTRTIIYPLELDIYLEDIKIAIEYNGVFWHSYSSLVDKEKQNKHQEKYIQCQEKGIDLIQINEDDWIHNKKKVKSLLFQKIAPKKSIKKYKIKEIKSNKLLTNRSSLELLQNNHENINLGLFNDNKLTTTISFFKTKNNFKIVSFGNKLFTNLEDSFKYLIDYFIKTYNPESLTYVSNCQYNILTKYLLECCFHKEELMNPKPKFVKTNKTKSYFQEEICKETLEVKYNETLSELQNMLNNDYRIMWDAGYQRFIWTNNS